MFDMMDVEDAIRLKRDIRKYLDKQIPNNIITKILEAGRLSQSSKNSQPWHFIVIKNKDKLKKLSQCTYSGNFLADANFGIAVVLHNAKLETDAGRAAQNMMLVAWKFGIGSCWITNFWEKAKELLGVPMTGGYKLITIIPFGYYEKPKQKLGKKIRKPLSEVAHLEELSISWEE